MDTVPAEPWGGEIQRCQEGKVSTEEGRLRDPIQSEHSPIETSGQKPRMHTDPGAGKHASSRGSPEVGQRSLFTIVPPTWSRDWWYMWNGHTSEREGEPQQWQLLEGICGSRIWKDGGAGRAGLTKQGREVERG